MTMTDWWVFANCDCLGCLMDARNAGDITNEQYDDIINNQQQQELMPTTPCPKCGKTAYISLYEPDVMHCPSCGLYSIQEPITGEWMPFRQGTVIERPS